MEHFFANTAYLRDCVSEMRPPMFLGEIAENIGLPFATLYRCVRVSKQPLIVERTAAKLIQAFGASAVIEKEFKPP